MIIHILGPSGSGKTTLGKKLAKINKNIIVLDTDDIDDKNILKLLPKYNMKYQKNRTKIFNERAKLNKSDLNKFLDKNKDKDIIFVGFDFDGMEKIPKLATKKYSIKIDHDTLFRQYNLRTLNLISKYKKDLEKLLKNKRQNIDNIWSLLSYKYKIRNGLFGMNPPQISNDIKNRKKEAKKKKYKYITSDEIFKDIKILIL